MNNPQNPQSNRAECRPPFVPPDHPDFETGALIFAASFEEGAIIDGKFVPGETGEWHLQLPRWRKVTRDSQGNIDRVAAEELERAESLQTHPIAFTVDELIELYQTWDGSLYILGRIGEGGPAEDGPFDLGSDHPPMQMIKGRPSDRLCRCPFWYIDLDVSSLLGSESQTPPYWGGAEIRSDLFDHQHLNDTTKYIQGGSSGLFKFFNDPNGRFDGAAIPAVYISTDFASFARETMDRIRIRVGEKWSSGSGGPWTDNPVQTRISSEAEEWEAAVWNYINYIYSGFPDLYAIKEYSHDTRTVVQKAIDASWISVEVDYLVDLEGGVEGQFSPGDTPDTCPLIPDAEPGDPPDPEEDLLELGSEGTWTVSLTTDPTKRARLKIDIKIRDPDGDFGDTFWIVFGDYNAFISGQISSDPGYDPAQDLSDTIASFDFETLYEGMRLHVNKSPDPQLPWDTSPTWHKPSANQLRTGVSPTTAHIWSYESEDFWTHSGIRAEIQGSDPAIQSRGWLTSCSGVGKYSLRVSLDILSGDVLWDGDQEIYRFPFIFKGWSPAIESIGSDGFVDAFGGWWSTMPPLHEDWEEYGGSKIETAINSFYDPNNPAQEPTIDLSPPVWADPFYANIHFLFEWLYYAVLWSNKPTQFPIIDNPPVPGTEETITLRFTDEFEFQITVWKSNVDVDFSFLHPDD